MAPAAKAFRWRAALATLRALRARRYDVALDFQGLWKSAAWARLSGARASSAGRRLAPRAGVAAADRRARGAQRARAT